MGNISFWDKPVQGLEKRKTKKAIFNEWTKRVTPVKKVFSFLGEQLKSLLVVQQSSNMMYN